MSGGQPPIDPTEEQKQQQDAGNPAISVTPDPNQPKPDDTKKPTMTGTTPTKIDLEAKGSAAAAKKGPPTPPKGKLKTEEKAPEKSPDTPSTAEESTWYKAFALLFATLGKALEPIGKGLEKVLGGAAKGVGEILLGAGKIVVGGVTGAVALPVAAVVGVVGLIANKASNGAYGETLLKAARVLTFPVTKLIVPGVKDIATGVKDVVAGAGKGVMTVASGGKFMEDQPESKQAQDHANANKPNPIPQSKSPDSPGAAAPLSEGLSSVGQSSTGQSVSGSSVSKNPNQKGEAEAQTPQHDHQKELAPTLAQTAKPSAQATAAEAAQKAEAEAKAKADANETPGAKPSPSPKKS